MNQQVILVNENDEEVGTVEKMEAHRKALLHRAFSVFIFNAKGEMLLQQRAKNKYHSPGLWTNTCCSHPYPLESTESAATRRLQEELGFTTTLKKIFDFTYRSEFDNGLTEFEFDHVFVGEYNDKIIPNMDEVNECCFMSFDAIEERLLSHPQKFTPWFHIAYPMVKEWREKNPEKIAASPAQLG
ncbi:MAG TPA: isopentenyl-diphosphate Delta-isomerase [Puia sp.]|nr:isopentenyl-diphosphate Delta-isomerase [Puia sp.]